MRYPDGQLVRLGDRVKLGADDKCTIVSDIDGDEYSEAHPKEQWGYLGNGVMLESPLYGLIHMESPDPDMQLLSRKQ